MHSDKIHSAQRIINSNVGVFVPVSVAFLSNIHFVDNPSFFISNYLFVLQGNIPHCAS
jgi:hypothetical protein